MSTRKKIIISILVWFFVYNPLFFIAVDNSGVSEDSWVMTIILAIVTYLFLDNKDKIFKKDKNKKVEESFAFKAGRTLRSSKILIYVVILILGIALGSILTSNKNKAEKIMALENRINKLESSSNMNKKTQAKIRELQDCINRMDIDELGIISCGIGMPLWLPW